MYVHRVQELDVAGIGLCAMGRLFLAVLNKRLLSNLVIESLAAFH